MLKLQFQLIMKIFTLFLLITTSFCFRVFGQSSDSLSSVWAGSFTAGGFYQSGNTNKIYLYGNGEIRRADRIIETILNLTAGYGEKNQIKDEYNLLSIFTADLYYEKRWSPFILQILEYNFAKGIELHSQSGAGLKYVFIPFKKNKSSISLALIYDYINLTDKPGNSDVDKLRYSFRIKTHQNLLNSRVIFSGVGFYQPAVTNFADVNIRIQSSFEVNLTGQFSVNATFLYAKEDVVSIGRKREDSKLTFGVGFEF